MGAWDVGSFGNDTACDWAYGLEDVDDLTYVEAAFDKVLRSGPRTTVDADAAESAVAAAEVVARLKGHWGVEDSYSETTDNWFRKHPLTPTRALIKKAVAALERVARAPSELLELWAETSESEAWIESVDELKGADATLAPRLHPDRNPGGDRRDRDLGLLSSQSKASEPVARQRPTHAGSDTQAHCAGSGRDSFPD